MGFLMFSYSMVKNYTDKIMEIKKHKTPEINPKMSPRMKEIIRRNQSLDNFMKHEVPWIL